MHRLRLTLLRATVLTGLYLVIWGSITLALAAARGGRFGDLSTVTVLGQDPVRVVSWVVDPGGWIGFYLIGLVWMVYLLEWAARRIEAHRRPADPHARPLISVCGEIPGGRRGKWNPFDPASRLYGFVPSFFCFLILIPVAVMARMPDSLHLGEALTEPVGKVLKFCALLRPVGDAALVLLVVALATAVAQSKRVRQSLSMITAYSLLFMLAYFLAHQSASAEELEYDLPPGGGSDAPQAMSVKVQKVIRKKYVVNPYSSILFAAPPPIENIDVKLTEDTANRYQVGQGDGGLGQGDGEGGGFGSGKGTGKIRFIRLRHSDKTWDKNFNIGGDKNLLMELLIRYPKMVGKVADESESMDIATLGTHKPKAAPPLVYVGGAHTFAPTAADKRVLKQYLTERHGMILGDNLGGSGFHGNFLAAMNEVTETTPVDIPRDDPIHKRPFELPQFPFVVAHGGTVPKGWKIDGRWAVYYHPGALSDAWRDDRAGIKKSIADQCFQLGINIISYAHREADTWRRSQQP